VVNLRIRNQNWSRLYLILTCLPLAVALLLSSCAYSPTPASAPTPIPAQPSAPAAKPTPTPELTPTPTPPPLTDSESPPTPKQEPISVPVNIRIDYVGVENAYGGNVQLVVVVSDGDKIEKYSVPRDDEYYSMYDFEVQMIGRRVFHTAALKGDLKLNILAYHRDQVRKTNLKMINMMEWYYGDSINMLKNLVLNMPEDDKLIGEYECTWYLDEPLHIGQYYKTSGDLHVWFSVWSDTEPMPVSEPILLPDIKIQSITLPTNTKQRSKYETLIIKTYYTTFMLVNNESVDITVDWQGHSSIRGVFDSGSITVPKRSSISVKRDYYYDTAGVEEITYKIFYRSAELDSWSGTLNVAP